LQKQKRKLINSNVATKQLRLDESFAATSTSNLSNESSVCSLCKFELLHTSKYQFLYRIRQMVGCWLVLYFSVDSTICWF